MSTPVTILGVTVPWPTEGDTGYSNATTQFVQLVSSAVAPISGLYNTTTGHVGNLALDNLDRLTLNGVPVAAGTVNSVAVGTLTPALTVTGSPITSSGTINLDLNVFTSSNEGIVPASGGGTTNFLRADGTWASPPGSASPLTTKGDLYTFTTTNARLPVGTNGQVLAANSATATGLQWVNAATGTVTSVAVSSTGGTISFSGSPITSSGTINLDVNQGALTLGSIGGTLPINKGGTGQTSANAALNALLPTQAGNSGRALVTDGTNTSWALRTNGTVTSVAASSSGTITIGGSPITSSGTLTLDVNQGALSLGSIGGTLNLATQTTGTLAVARGGTGATTLTGYVKGNGTSAFTASATVPGSDVSGNISGNAANVTGVVAIANGGTGQTSQTAAFDALAPTTTKGDLIVHNGTDNIRVPVGTNGQALVVNSATASGVEWATVSGAGTVTSVTVAGTADEISSSGSPITTSGTITIGLANNPIIPGNQRMKLPTGSTANRPGTPSQGDFRFNTTTDVVEVYKGSAAWKSLVGLTNGNFAISGFGSHTANSAELVPRTMTGGTNITVTNGDGVSGNPTFDLTGVVDETNGGTGQSTYTTGDTLYSSATNTLAKLPIGTANQVLMSTGTVPTWLTPDRAVVGLVRVATTANITLSGNVVIDGVTTAPGDRVLVKNQTTTSENGVYTSQAGAWTRTTDDPYQISGAVVPVSFGTVNSGTVWRYDGPTSNTWAQVGDRISVATDATTTGLTFTASSMFGAFATRWNGRGNQTCTFSLGGTLAAGHGGTGQSSYTSGDILYATGATTLTKLGIGSSGQVLTVTAGAPTWQTPSGGGGGDVISPFLLMGA